MLKEKIVYAISCQSAKNLGKKSIKSGTKSYIMGYDDDFIFVFDNWNFMHKLEKNVTPAILEEQATKVWAWGNFLHAKLSYTN